VTSKKPNGGDIALLVFGQRFGRRTCVAAAFALSALACGESAHACATCGCTLSKDWLGPQLASVAGWAVGMSYDFLDQNQMRTGRTDIACRVLTLTATDVVKKLSPAATGSRRPSSVVGHLDQRPCSNPERTLATASGYISQHHAALLADDLECGLQDLVGRRPQMCQPTRRAESGGSCMQRPHNGAAH
jgi:hypothetical protein